MLRSGFLEGESPLRTEKRYIGSFSMPFETVYREGRIEGVFRVDAPAINFGYDHVASTTPVGVENGGGMFIGSNDRDSSPGASAAANEGDMLQVAQAGLLGALDCFLQCLVSSDVKKPREYDSLHSSSSFIHRRTHVLTFHRTLGDCLAMLLPKRPPNATFMLVGIRLLRHG